jgi:hypothetical protein
MQEQANSVCSTHISRPPIVIGSLQQQQRQRQQQQQQRAESLKKWRHLEAREILPGPEQLLLALEVALLQPDIHAVDAMHLWCSTAEQLSMHGGMEAAVELLLQPFLHLLGPAVVHCSAALELNNELGNVILLQSFAITTMRLVQCAGEGELCTCVACCED